MSVQNSETGFVQGIQESELLCPNCGSTIVGIVEILAPKDEEEATADTFVGGVGGATIGGALGAVFGPGGVILGIIGGGAAGGSAAFNNATSKRAELQCRSCGHTWQQKVDS